MLELADVDEPQPDPHAAVHHRRVANLSAEAAACHVAADELQVDDHAVAEPGRCGCSTEATTASLIASAGGGGSLSVWSFPPAKTRRTARAAVTPRVGSVLRVPWSAR